MSQIHPTAIIDGDADLHPSVSVGPHSIIEAGVTMGEGCRVESSVRIFSGVTMGSNNRVYHGTVLGCEPQDLGFTVEKSKPLVIGNGNHFKEGVNISRGYYTDEGTLIGDGNYFMCGFHAGHDCHFGSNNVFGPNSAIAGHVELGDRVFISGLVAIHQFCFIGDYAMVAGCAKVVKDIPPYVIGDGNPARIAGLNSVGLKRAGFSARSRSQIKQVYKTLHQSDLNISQALEQLRVMELSPEGKKIVEFYDKSERGVTAHR